MDVPRSSSRLRIADVRHVGFSVWGESDPGAPVVVHCHGTPGGRLTPYQTAVDTGMRHVSLDRPGFGLSDPHPSRTVGHHARDVEQVLDHLGVDRFSVFGWSGGGPHALAIGALLPERAARVAVLGCPAPHDDPSFDVTADMPAINVESHRMLIANPEGDRLALEKAVLAFFDDPEAFLGQVEAVMDPVDLVVGRDPNMKARFIEQLRDAFQNGSEGWFEDDMVTIRPWGFVPEDVRPEVWLWHGELDRLVPISNGRYLAGHLPGCKTEFLAKDGHLSPLARLSEILDWLVQPLLERMATT